MLARVRQWAGRELSLWLAMTVPAIAAMALSARLLRPQDADLGGLAGIAAVVLVAGTGWGKFAPSVLRRIPMLPVINLAALAAVGLVAPGLSSTFTGFFMVTFCFVGLTRPRWTSLLLLPLAVPSWLLDYTPVTGTTLARLPIAAGCWILVSELIASYRSQQMAVQVDLQRQLDRDALTGLSSRRDLDVQLGDLTDGDTVVFIDLDHFKRINDSHGHTAGDEVLAQFGTAVLTVTGSRHRAVRYGGEEILVLLRQAPLDEALSLLTKLHGVWGTVRPDVTFSAGVCAVAAGGGADALRLADQALYQAKNEGRDCWRVAGVPAGAVDGPGTGSSDDDEGRVAVPLPRTADSHALRR
jgi:diguanylate cyclase (GGDEF)-like protein